MRISQPHQNLAAIALVLGLGVPAWLWIRAAPEPPRVTRPPHGPVQVRTLLVEARDVRLSVLAFGTLEPARSSRLAVLVAGRVERRLDGWRPGRRVTAGEELLALDDRLAQLELDRARALESEAEQALVQRRLEAELAPAREAMARENRELTEREVERVEQLLATGSTSPSILDQKRMAALGAELAWREASDREVLARAAVAAAEAAVSSGKAGVALAAEQVRRHVLHAPFDGELTGRGPEVGSFLSPLTLTPVAEVVDRSVLHLVVHVPEHESGRLALGAPATVLVPARPDWSADAPLRVCAIAPRADAATRSLAVEIDVPAGDRVPLAAGLFATAELELGHERAAVVVARRHMVWEADQAVAYVARRSAGGVLEAERRVLELGPAVDEGFLVRAGLEAGDELVTGPLERLSDGRALVRRLVAGDRVPGHWVRAPPGTPPGRAEGSR